MPDRKIEITLRDYEPGSEPDPLTLDRIESQIATMLDNDGSDGIVIVEEPQRAPVTEFDPHGASDAA